MTKGGWNREFLAVIDGTLGGPDAIFKLMEYYLRELRIAAADKVLSVADGARWIWNCTFRDFMHVMRRG